MPIRCVPAFSTGETMQQTLSIAYLNKMKHITLSGHESVHKYVQLLPVLHKENGYPIERSQKQYCTFSSARYSRCPASFDAELPAQICNSGIWSCKDGIRVQPFLH